MIPPFQRLFPVSQPAAHAHPPSSIRSLFLALPILSPDVPAPFAPVCGLTLPFPPFEHRAIVQYYRAPEPYDRCTLIWP